MAQTCYLPTMITAKQRNQLLLADQTGDTVWINAVVEQMLATNPNVTPVEVETAFRDGAARSYLIVCPDKTLRVITGDRLVMLAALAEAGMTVEENLQALADRR